MIKLLGANSYWVRTLYQTSHFTLDTWADVVTYILRNWALKILSTCLCLQRKQPWIVADSKVSLLACSSSECELKTWGQCPSLPLISCVTSGQWPNLSASQIYPTVYCWRSNEIFKCLRKYLPHWNSQSNTFR